MPEEADHSYVLCIDDGGYPESLEVRKVYVTLRDRRAEQREYTRIIDETGQDYLYPASLFVPIQVPPEVDQLMSVGYWQFKAR